MPQVLVPDGRVSNVTPNSLAWCTVQRVPGDRQGRTREGSAGRREGGGGRSDTHTCTYGSCCGDDPHEKLGDTRGGQSWGHLPLAQGWAVG